MVSTEQRSFKGEDMHWLAQALMALLLVIPGWISMRFFARNHAIPGGIFMVWYFCGGTLGGAIIGSQLYKATVFYPISITVPIIIIGMVIGAGSNYLGFEAVTSAPNPGLAIAIMGSASAAVYIVSALLGKIAPHYFDPAPLNAQQLIGILLTVIGTSIIAFKK